MTWVPTPATISVDDLDLNTIDINGARWRFNSISGWHDGSSVDVDQVQRIVSHGQFPQAGHRGGRTITIEGLVEADTRGPVAQAADALAAVLADGGFGQFTFADDDLGERWVDVQLLATPTLAWDGDNSFTYQLQLLAPDSYRYGATSTDSTGFVSSPVGSGMVFDLFPDGVMDFGPLGDVGEASVRNLGNASATVRFSVAGPTPAAGFTITDTTSGQQITFLGVVPDGSVLVLDSADGSVLIDGVADRSGDTIVGAWPMIPKNASHSFLFEPIGSPTTAVLSVSCTATYW